MVVEADDIIGAGGMGLVVYPKGRQVERGTIEGSINRVVFIADVQHLVAAALGRRGIGHVVGVLVEARPGGVAQVRHAVDCQATEAMAADQHILAAQPLCAGIRGDFAQQGAKRLARVVFCIVRRAESSQQVVDHIANGVEDQVLPGP